MRSVNKFRYICNKQVLVCIDATKGSIMAVIWVYMAA